MRQVTASAVVTREGIVVVDTLPYPVETEEMISCLNDLGQGPIKYLVNTHWHGDHTYGNYLFDDSIQLVCHKKCLEAMLEYGPLTLEEARETTPLLDEVEVRVPDVVFDEGQLVLHVGNKSIEVTLTPGHTFDSTVAYVREDKVLLAADTVMPVPYFVWGDRDDFKESLRFLKEYNLESIVQGHGEVLLQWLCDEARRAGCNTLDLDSGTQRARAHKFYFGQGMTIAGYHFVASLDT